MGRQGVTKLGREAARHEELARIPAGGDEEAAAGEVGQVGVGGEVVEELRVEDFCCRDRCAGRAAREARLVRARRCAPTAIA